jgi:transposase
MNTPVRPPYPSDVSDEEWAFVAPYLALLPEEAGQRRYPLREVFNALRFVARTGAQWRLLPHDFPPWPAVYQQVCRRRYAGCYAILVDDLRLLLGALAGGGAGGPRPCAYDGHLR